MNTQTQMSNMLPRGIIQSLPDSIIKVIDEDNDTYGTVDIQLPFCFNTTYSFLIARFIQFFCCILSFSVFFIMLNDEAIKANVYCVLFIFTLFNILADFKYGYTNKTYYRYAFVLCAYILAYVVLQFLFIIRILECIMQTIHVLCMALCICFVDAYKYKS